jgi:hypothetical protein
MLICEALMTLKLSGSPIFLMFFRRSGAVSRLHVQWYLSVAGTWLLRTCTCFFGPSPSRAAVTMSSSFSTASTRYSGALALRTASRSTLFFERSAK